MTILAAALAGAALPDLSAVFLVLWAAEVKGVSEEVIFGSLYFSDAWQQIFAFDNSIPLWGTLLGVAIWQKLNLTRVFAASGLAHLVADFLLHHDDGRSHLWPITRWKFESPVSYWDSAHHGSTAAVVLFMISLAAFAVLVHRFQGWIARTLFLLLLGSEAFFAWVWIVFF